MSFRKRHGNAPTCLSHSLTNHYENFFAPFPGPFRGLHPYRCQRRSGRQQSHRRAEGRDKVGGHFLRSSGAGLRAGDSDPRGLNRWRGDLDGAGCVGHRGSWRECDARDGQGDCVECGSGLVGEIQHPDAVPGGGG